MPWVAAAEGLLVDVCELARWGGEQQLFTTVGSHGWSSDGKNSTRTRFLPKITGSGVRLLGGGKKKVGCINFWLRTIWYARGGKKFRLRKTGSEGGKTDPPRREAQA